MIAAILLAAVARCSTGLAGHPVGGATRPASASIAAILTPIGTRKIETFLLQFGFEYCYKKILVGYATNPKRP